MVNEKKDYSELARLTKKAMGERSLSQYSKDTGVSISHISRLINQKLNAIPSREIIAKLTKSENADPREGVTYEDLMIAAGYQQNYDQSETDLQEYDPISDNITISDNGDMNEKESTVREKTGLFSDEHRGYNTYTAQLEAIATGIIFGKLAEKGITFRSVPVNRMPLIGYRPRIIIKTDNYHFNTIWVEFLFLARHESIHRDYRTRCFWLMGRLVMQEPDPEKLTVIVTDSERVFEYFRSVSNQTSYMGNLSVVLIDQQSVRVTGEVFVCNYKNNVDGQIHVFE